MPTLKLPGLIDMHVHLRDPGQTHKEDFETGTAAAIAGGYTTVIDMPNNTVPITTPERLDEKIKIARGKTLSAIGFYYGSLGDNLETFPVVQDRVWGLKLYLNQTTGGFIINTESMTRIYDAWKSTHPILLHSEEDMIGMVIDVIRRTGQKSHICHVSSQHELEQIIEAKKEGLPVSCGVCPHHLFLTEDDTKTLGAYARMKPPLKPKKDVEFLWRNLNYVDAIESDHAPHTKQEKDSDNPPFGVPNLDTTLPMLLQAVQDKRITIKDIIRLCHAGPRQVLGLPEQPGTYVEVDMDQQYTIENSQLKTKCGWTPFAGQNVHGKVMKVAINDNTVYENDRIIAAPGSGTVMVP